MGLRLSTSASITPTRDAVILRSDLGSFAVQGADLRAFLDRIVPLLDGSRDRRALEEALSSYSAKSVGALLDVLRDRGLIEEAGEGPFDRLRGQDAFLARCGARGSLRGSRVAVLSMDPPRSIVEILTASGLGAIDVLAADAEPLARLAADPPALLIANLDPAGVDVVERVSRAAHAAGVPSLWAHGTAAASTLGPLVIPSRTACRVCATEGALSPDVPRGAPGGAGDLLASALALEAIKIITRYAPSSLAGRLWIQDLHTLDTRVHTLVRLPWCRVCGEGSKIGC